MFLDKRMSRSIYMCYLFYKKKGWCFKRNVWRLYQKQWRGAITIGWVGAEQRKEKCLSKDAFCSVLFFRTRPSKMATWMLGKPKSSANNKHP